MNYFDHNKYNVLVTGANGHIGESISKGFAMMGANVFLNGRDKKKIDILVKKFKKNNFNVTSAVFDINNYRQVKNFFSKNKKFHTIVNNAFSTKLNHYDFFEKKRFNDAFNEGITSVANIMKVSEKNLIKGANDNGTASIINILSMYAIVSPDPSLYNGYDYKSSPHNPPHYGAAKAGLLHFSKIAAVNLAKKKIRVNCISPGPFPNIKNIFLSLDQKFLRRLKRKNPMGRWGNPDELITTALYLSSKNSSYVTGVNIPVDGGWTIW
jgi:NAD(P)-dependent dehydrogenase (short-subunit alcohol dehydrogenase family)